MFCALQQHTPLWSPELYVLGVLPMWAAWVLLLRQANYCRQSGRCSWPLVQLVLSLCFLWKLLAACGLSCHEIAGCWDSRGPKSSLGPLVNKPRSQDLWFPNPGGSQRWYWLGGRQSHFLTQLAGGLRVSQSLCWTDDMWSWILALIN